MSEQQPEQQADQNERPPEETPAMDRLGADADRYAGEPLPDGDHDLDADSFADRDAEDVAVDTEGNHRESQPQAEPSSEEGHRGG